MNQILIKNTILQILKNVGTFSYQIGFLAICFYFLVTSHAIGLFGTVILGFIVTSIYDSYGQQKEKNLKDAINLELIFFIKCVAIILLICLAAIVVFILCVIILEYYKISLPIIGTAIIVFSVYSVYMSEKSKLDNKND